MIFAGGKDYVIHCYSLNTPRFYQAMEQQCMLMHTQPNPAAYDVGACGGSDAELYNLVGHSGKVRSLAYSKDLRVLASASEDVRVGVAREA